MSRKSAPPRLYLQKRESGNRWIILDRGSQRGTGAGEDDRKAAEIALAEYIGRKHEPQFGEGHPAAVLIADALEAYQSGHGANVRRPDLIGIATLHLLEFFGERTVATVTAGAAAEYVAWRTAQGDARAKRNARPVKVATARRELVVLAAALAWCWRAGKIDRLLPVALPPSAAPRERHLTRSEAARLLAGAIGFAADGTRNRARINRHLARFILLALYTGTRHDAILRLQWIPNTAGGWIDLAAGVLYRRPQGATDSGKRRPPLPIPPRLLPHLRRWKRLSARFVIEHAGRPIASQERRAWVGARQLAGLGPEVTPHVLRHTAATWLLTAGVSTWDVAGVLGCGEDVIRRTYGHHAKGALHAAVRAFSRR